jgi:hypothetical protein
MFENTGKRNKHMMIGMKTLGLNLFNRMLVKGSKTEYETKNIESEALYCPVVMLCKLFCNPSILALPMLVRSKKARR